MQGQLYGFPDDEEKAHQRREANEALAQAMLLRRLREVIARDVHAELRRRDEEQQEEKQQKRSRLRAAAEAVGVCFVGLGTMAVGIFMLWRAR